MCLGKKRGNNKIIAITMYCRYGYLQCFCTCFGRSVHMACDCIMHKELWHNGEGKHPQQHACNKTSYVDLISQNCNSVANITKSDCNKKILLS